MKNLLPLIKVAFLFGAVCFAITPAALAVDPPPDGGYPSNNTAEGTDPLFSLTTGSNNTGVGFDALYSNTTGSYNTAIGSGALSANTIGNVNTGIGPSALSANTAGSANTAVGYNALAGNTGGGANTAIGNGALFSNTVGFQNTATGAGALENNTAGAYNTGIGEIALFYNTTGSLNAAIGYQALYFNTTGSGNVAMGSAALIQNTTGNENTANGAHALSTNKTGGGNTDNGSGALYSNRFGSHNTADGFNALYNNRTGAFNIALGDSAGFNTTGRNNINIGNQGVAGESNAIRVGTVGTQTATYIAGISGVTVADGVGVVIDTNGQLGTIVSSERFKDNIKPMDRASEAILALKPVTFRYKPELDPAGIPQFGLVAEEVAKVNPDLVARDADGKAYTVRYEAVNAMLLNEFLKEHRTVQELRSTVAKQEATITQQQKDFRATAAEQQKQIEALTVGLQKVSAQIELSKFATGRIRLGGAEPQVAKNNQ